MTDLAKLPVTVITGFLGSGKTTLVSQLMQNPGGKRLAVVVNEFGDVGVDGDILKSCAIPDCPAENIMELANGCICCTVADDFIPTIEALMALDPRPDHILIETSGLALPKPLLKAFDWPDIRSKITVDGVIALADAEAVAAGRFAPDVAAVDAQRAADESIDHETPLSEVFEDQISCADIILLTKPDLAGPEGVAKAKEIIAAEAPRPLPVVEVAEGVVDPRVILGLEAAAEDDMDARPSHHDGHDDHEHDDFESIVVDIPELAETVLPFALTVRIPCHEQDRRPAFIDGKGRTGNPGPQARRRFNRKGKIGLVRCAVPAQQPEAPAFVQMAGVSGAVPDGRAFDAFGFPVPVRIEITAIDRRAGDQNLVVDEFQRYLADRRADRQALSRCRSFPIRIAQGFQMSMGNGLRLCRPVDHRQTPVRVRIEKPAGNIRIERPATCHHPLGGIRQPGLKQALDDHRRNQQPRGAGFFRQPGNGVRRHLVVAAQVPVRHHRSAAMADACQDKGGKGDNIGLNAFIRGNQRCQRHVLRTHQAV